MSKNTVIEKAVIPVAGLGTRMLPATKAIPKEMLPIVDKPMIQYVVNEAVAAGINQIVLVTHASKNSVENHFDTSFELEAQLEKRLKRQLLEEVRSIVPKGVTIISVRQSEAKGLGHAISCAYPVVGDNPFAVLLPDVLVDQYRADLTTDNLAAMVNRFNQTGFSQILVEPVPQEDVHNYGVIDCNGENIDAGKTAKINNLVEKPPIETAPSNLAIVGRYVLSAEVWPLLKKIKPGTGGEIQLTDAIGELLKTSPVEAYRIIGKSHDCGTKFGYICAQIEYALRNDQVGSKLRKVFPGFIELLQDSKV